MRPFNKRLHLRRSLSTSWSSFLTKGTFSPPFYFHLICHQLLFTSVKFLGFYFKDQQSESDHSQQHGQPPGASRSQARTGSRISNQSSHSKNKRSSIASLPASLLNLGEVIENVSISWHGVLEFFLLISLPIPLIDSFERLEVRFSIWINELKYKDISN